MTTTGIRPQLFGTKKSADTRKAQRFFAERRVPVHFVDLAEKGASLGELRRFAQKHGVQALIDRDSRRFAELGLRAALYGDERWLTLLVDEPLLLRQPLVRIGPWVGIGVDEAAWKEALLKAAG
jgi:arsenate reductase-like glutaredoxin family protein